MQAICEECGQPYKTTQSKYNAYKHHYCSRECVNRMRKRSFLHNFVEKNGQKWKLVDYPDKSCVIIKCRCCGGLRELHSCQIVSYSIICPEYERDKGICHLCGGHCDYSDHKVTEEGYFIAGLRYPSIDHVVPLSKGGTHTWENVKLACFGCNVAKGNRDGISPPIFANQ